LAKSSSDSPPLNGEIIEPRKFNDPTLPPKEFLLAVMHDERVPMAARIDAAKAVAVYEHPRLAQVTQDVTAGVRIIIEGGLPALPGTNIIMPESAAMQEAAKKTNGSGGHEE
jgi:hypothetical protein